MTVARRVGTESVVGLWLAGGAALLALMLGADARAQSCTGDGDCADGFGCDLGPMATRDCSGGAGAAACDAGMPEARSGECEPRKMTCKVDSDCVTGLICEHRDDGDCAVTSAPNADGGAPDEPHCEPPAPSPGECVYEFVDCKKDSDCKDGLICQPLGATQECSESGSACEQGQECPAPEEPVCTETTTSYCFPARVDCKGDDDCKHDTRCVALSDDAQEDPPPGWEGATALCLPEAIALVLERRVGTLGASSRSEDSSVSKGGSSDSAEDVASHDTAGGGNNVNDAGTAAHDLVKDAGCAVSAPGTRNTGHAWLLLLGAALITRRRRVARRP